MSESINKQYQCQECGNIKTVMINHDQLPVIWERCSDDCMWKSGGERGPVLHSANGEKTGFYKRKFKRCSSFYKPCR